MSTTEVQLSPFQKEKLNYFFQYLEPDASGNLTNQSLEKVMKKILKYTGWSADTPKVRQCKEIHDAFFEILFQKSEEEGGDQGTASLEIWYRIWSHLLPGCKGMSNFPVWLRLMPRILFDIIDRDDNVIEEKNLLRFYKEMVNVKDADLEKNTKEAYKQMTDDGRYPLHCESYEQIFANFLIGKTPHGPGKYIFGLFQHDDANYELIKPVDAEEEDEEITSAPEKRPKKFGIKFT